MTYVRFMKDVEEGKIISVKSLELQEEFAKGRLDDFNYSSDFESIEEEVHFWEMVVAVENYFQTTIDTPKEIYDSEYSLLTELSFPPEIPTTALHPFPFLSKKSLIHNTHLSFTFTASNMVFSPNTIPDVCHGTQVRCREYQKESAYHSQRL